ncbi:MAG: hemoglobin [Cyclobacteriaceae bacterium]|jgi:hemoglobin
MERKDIESREDIELLVHTFYSKVRKHTTLGPIFNQVIDNWDEHLDKLCGFWETNLFFVQKYKGNPLQTHLDVDKELGHQIDQLHFGNWLNLWFETLDELYHDKNAEIAKHRARNMAHIMFIRIWEARNKKQQAT